MSNGASSPDNNTGYQSISLNISDGVATLALNRPDKLNACTELMFDELIDAFDRIDADDDVRAAIVTGTGRAFCAGADLSAGPEIFTSPAKGAADDSGGAALDCPRDGGGRLTLRIFQCLKPVIAAINGPAIGVGVTMTLPMDIRIASDRARFGFVFARRGIVPEAASSYFLPRIVGISRALSWCYSGEIFDAPQALEAGLISEICPEEDLLSVANALARKIADHTAPVSVALTRQMFWRGLGMSHPMEAHRLDSRVIASRGVSDDAQEGVNAFLEKRQALFPDRVSKDMPLFFPWWKAEQF